MGFPDLPPDPPTDLQGPPLPALVSGTSQEFLGQKPLPRVIRDRSLVFVIGPEGVGKTSVGKVLAGRDAVYLNEEAVLEALTTHARTRSWSEPLTTAPKLVLECPCFLDRRPAALAALKLLLRERAGGGRRTIVVEARSGTAIERVMEGVHPGYRATLVLRFPVGRGRQRFARRLCEQLNICPSKALETTHLEPWSYASVRAHLTQTNG